MSEAKLISPLLDGFLMGSPMGEHDGVACCPAMKEDSDHKYIVKIISVPASQKQLDALLLAGAYRKPEEAMKYFKELADGVVAEAQCLQDLAKLEGFLPYEGWQVEPMEKHDVGYQVYLLGSYRRSLEKHMRRTMLTHLDAINLALDLCSALSTVRRAGYIYVDLKPTNIFLSEDKSCQIGDLGFVPMDAFRYTALPEKYLSDYTPPELRDPMADLNGTVDTYALGMVLYRIYNDGQLPKDAGESGYPTPVNADYELAEIILKALAPKPEDRWKDPQEMGKALAAYMQRNSVNETPVTPPSTVIYDPADVVTPEPQEEPEAEPEETDQPQEDLEPQEPTLEQIEEDVRQEIEEPPADETLPTAEDAPEPGEEVLLSQETSTMVSQADELLAQEVPGGDFPDFDENSDPFAAFLAGQEDWTPEVPVEEPESQEFLSDPIYDETHSRRQPPAKKEHKVLKLVTKLLVLLLILGGLAVGGWFGYTGYYLQTIDSMTVEGSQTGLTVTVQTGIDNQSLTVACVDSYGNALRQPLVNGKAQFTNLQPKSTYEVSLEMEGFHKLVGETSVFFTTEDQTSIKKFDAIAGAEEGSVMLTFTVDGPEPDEWTLVCSTEGEKPREEVFSGHDVTVKDLTLGKTYTFHLETDDDTQIVGNQTVEFTVSSVFTAENLHVASNGPEGLVIAWDTPQGASIESWNVHCFNEDGFDQMMTVVINQATFTGLDPSMNYIVEVTAEGMSQPVRTTISANPITLTDFQVEETGGALNLSWTFSGEAPENGWLLSYGVDSMETQTVIQCAEPKAVVEPILPGVSYHFVVQTAAGASIFNNTHDYSSAPAPEFDQFGLNASAISAKLVKTPKNSDWNASMLKASSYGDTFIPGDPVSMVLHASQDFYLEKEPITALYVLRDSEGRVLSKMTIKEELTWNDLWMGGDYHDAELDLPTMPVNEGQYSITVYFNNAFVASCDFTIEKA